MEASVKLVCFDLDDTLIYGIHSVMLLCILNNKLEQLLEIEKREQLQDIDWITADYYKAELIAELNVSKIQDEYSKIVKPINNIHTVIDSLHKKNIQCIVITAGPVQVAQVIKENYNLDGFYGSEYEAINGVFSGKILNHLGDTGKVSCLQEYCKKNNILPDECVAVGDGFSDIPLFEYCKKSIALNSSQFVKEKATHFIDTRDLSDILDIIV